MREKRYSKGRANLRYRGEGLNSSAPVLAKKPKKVQLQEVRKRPATKLAKKNLRSRFITSKRYWRTAKQQLKKIIIKPRIVTALVLLLIALTAIIFVSSRNGNEEVVISEVLSSQSEKFSTEAGFPVILPGGNDSQTTSSRYDTERGVYQYQDVLEEVTIIVSEQLLPDDIRETPSKIKNIALSTPGTTQTEQIQTKKGVAYLSKTATGTQVMILIHEDLLIFINSQLIISNESWLEYVNGLR